MNKSILINGIAGSGKSAVCAELKKLGYKAYDIEIMEGLFSLVNKTTKEIVKDYDKYDKNNLESVKQHNWICDKKKLQQLVRKNSKGIVFYCGTAVNLDDLLPLFDKIFLLKTSQKVLRERLSTRTSSDFARTPEVQDWIFRWKNWQEDQMREKGAIVIDANRSLQEIATDIIQRSNYL